MASWQELKSYIGSRYRITEDDGVLVKMIFDTGNGRSQIVLVNHNSTGAGEEFAVIASPVATAGSIEPLPLLREVSEYVVGGLVLYGDLLMIRHAVPLADLDAGDFEQPLRLVIGAADAIEAKFVGADAY